jgi:CheY-like chemotaxis protein
MKPLALIVENDAGTRKLLDVLLTRLGYETDVVSDGGGAAILAERIAYHFLIVDLAAVQARGAEVMTRLRELRVASLARTVVLTAAPDAQIERMQREWPSVRILRKPFELNDLIDAANAAREHPVERLSTAAIEFSRHSIVAGAKAGLLVRRAGNDLQLVTEFGYPRGVVDRWFPFPIDANLPICDSVREQRPLWLSSIAIAERNYPKLATAWASSSSRALATVPVIRNGNAVGAAGWSFHESRLFDDAERRRFTEIARKAEPLVPESNDAPQP